MHAADQHHAAAAASAAGRAPRPARRPEGRKGVEPQQPAVAGAAARRPAAFPGSRNSASSSGSWSPTPARRAGACAPRASARPAPGGRNRERERRTSRAGRQAAAQSHSVGWNSRHMRSAVAVRERVPDDQDSLQPHADIDHDRRSTTSAEHAAPDAGTRAPAAGRSCRASMHPVERRIVAGEHERDAASARHARRRTRP